MPDCTKLFQFIEHFIRLGESDKRMISELATTEKLEKGDVLVNQGQVCTQLRFLLSGIYRVYQLRDGKEITSYFNYEYRNLFVGAFVSLLTQQPSNEIVECIQDGKVLVIEFEEWKDLYLRSERLNTFGRMITERNYVLAMERIESLQFKSATDRYEAFMQQYPGMLNLIPHHYIASYLGVTPESLSRIRKSL